MAKLIRDDFAFADSQYHILMKHIPPSRMPQTFDSVRGKVICYGIDWWCSGFYAGSLWYIYEQTGDSALRLEAERALKVLKPDEYDTSTHDVGFMMNCSFGNAYRLTKDTAYADALTQSAKSLSTRYRPRMRAIQSWDRGKGFNCPVIIDNMMNLELLEWASANGRGERFDEIARIHAATTMQNHFRPDYSSYHVVDYDPATGHVLRKATYQGYSDSSAWSRGQAWGLYGYTMMYRYTHDPRYLNLARHIAAFILGNPHLPIDKVPYWDFNAPGTPETVRDASAAAIMASALLELGQYTRGKEKEQYVDNATVMLKSLSGPAYRAQRGAWDGFLLLHSTGAYPERVEVDMPLIYADYYFLEALKRYKDWYL